ncbi:MAG: ORF6N domain-containing protein [Lachnospiraceae bacterium]|nr:ORF6N domain-containing protein [Lachnospiraceae bacterium]
MSDIEKDIIISEEMLKEKIYEIRGQKVMLDFELAEIYGYTTKAFNQQVKNNIEKFDEDFMFRLTKEELDELSRSNFLTLNSRAGRGSNIKYCPYAFTEQGIYIYNQAKDSIYIIDNYIGLKTFELLIGSIPGVKIILFSDNVGNSLHKSIFDDFCKEHSDIQIQLRKTNGIFHDRYVILDYNTENEKVFLCGGSSKDAGGRVTTISEVFETKMFHSLIDTMFNNPMLELN